MLKIGDFSKLSQLTVKALRFYEKEGLLKPASVDEWTGYRSYETTQLTLAAKIKSYRQLGLSIEEIRAILSGADEKAVLSEKADTMYFQKANMETRLSIIKSILEGKKMHDQVNEKNLPEMIVFSSETVLAKMEDKTSWIPSLGKECLELNPNVKCTDPEYEFCELLDGEYRKTNVRIRHSQAVRTAGKESETIKFRKLPATKVLSIYHKGAYETLGEAYAFIMEYAEKNGYRPIGLPRECYIDGIWNRETPDEYLTEIQLPIAENDQDETSKITFRLEKPEEYREVENMVRDSFWNIYRPGCLEHFVLHELRNDPAFVKDLDFVMEYDGQLVGQNMFMRAEIAADDGRKIPIMTMGPICVTPALKRKGFGKRLLDYSLEKATQMGCGAICFEGNIKFYGKSGFDYASNFGIRYHGLPKGEDASFFLCKELIPGYLNGVTGEYTTPDGYFVDETAAEEFDKQFPPKVKLKLPGQLA